MDGIVNPTAWLWGQLECVLTPLQLSELRSGFRKQSDHYNRAAKIRQVKREIAALEKCIEHSIRPDYYRKRVEKRKVRLAQLENER